MKPHIFLFLTDITLDGGVERVVSNMANFFACNDYETTIISLFAENNDVKYQLNQRIKIRYVKTGISQTAWLKKHTFGPQLSRRILMSLQLTKYIYNIVDGEAQSNPSVILCNSYLYTPLYRHKNVKIIGLDHSRYPFGSMVKGLKHWLHTYMVRKFDIVTTLNIEELDKWNSIGRPVHVIPNFIPQSIIDNAKNDGPRQKNILSMGRMNTDQKGFDRLIDAYSLIAMKHPDWKVIIYGCGKYQTQYRKQIELLRLQDYITIYDYTQNPQEVYKRSSIYAMCSREEGFSMVLLEAGVLGLPLIAYDVDFGPKSIIKQGETGYIVPNNDRNMFAEKIELLMNDKILREQMSDRVNQDITERYSEKVIMNKWTKLINTL